MLIIGVPDATSPNFFKDFWIAAHDEDTGELLGQWTVSPSEVGIPYNFLNYVAVHPTAPVVYLFGGLTYVVTLSLIDGTTVVTDLRDYFSPTPTSVSIRTGERSPAVSADGSALMFGVFAAGGAPTGWLSSHGVARLSLDENGAIVSGKALNHGSASIASVTYERVFASPNGRFAAVGVYYSAGTGDRRYYNAVLDFDTDTVVVSRYQSEATTTQQAWGTAISSDSSTVFFAQDVSTNRGVFASIPSGSPITMTDTSILSAANLTAFEPGSTTRVLRTISVESDGLFSRVYTLDSALPSASALVEECPNRVSSGDPGYIGIDAVWRDGPEVLVVRGVWDGASTYELEVARRGVTGAVIGALTHSVPGFANGFTQTLRAVKSGHSERAAAAFTFSGFSTYDMYVVLVNVTTLAATVITPPVLAAFAGSNSFGFTSGSLAAPEFWTRVEGAFA